MLERLDTELNAQGIHMAFIEMRTRLHDLVYRYGLFEALDRTHFYATIDVDDDRQPSRVSARG